MDKRTLSVEPERRALLLYLKDFMRQEYGDVIRLEFSRKYSVGVSGMNGDPVSGFPRKGYVGSNGVFISDKLNLVHKDVSEDDLTAIVVAAFHECRHAVVYKAMSDATLAADYPDLKYMSVAHLASIDNDYYNRNNWPNFITEIDAERFGLIEAGELLAEYYGSDKAEQLLLKYVNRSAAGNFYPIVKKGNMNYPYTSLDTVYDDFDVAYERSKHVSRVYSVPYEKESSGAVKDEAFQYFAIAVSERAQYEFVHHDDGYEQDSIMASIALRLHPEYKGYYIALADEDLTLDTTFGVLCDNWNDIDEHFEPPVEKKAVPEGVRKIQEREAYHNKLLAKRDFSQSRYLRELDKSSQSDNFEFQ